MNGSPVTMATIIRWMAAAGGVMLPGAVLATGLHQTTLEYVPEMILAFGVLRRMGEWVLASGFLLWFLNGLFSHHRETSLAWRGAGAVCWLFGSVLVFFGSLPEIRRASLTDLDVYALPVLLPLLSLGALFLLLSDSGERHRHAVWGRRTHPGGALAASVWLAFLIVFVAMPVAYAWSLVWNRGMGGIAGIAGGGGLLSGVDSLFSTRYWSLGCLVGRGGCGSAINSLALGSGVALLAGLLGSALALYVHQSSRQLRKWVAVLVCLPMITPPFLIGFGLAQLFGRAGLVSIAVDALFGFASSRWFFGPVGVMMAQVVVFFPLAYFLVLHALDSVGRSQIDAARYLGASNGDVLRTVVLPALRDPLAVAMLVIFVETLSDIGNPLIIGGKLRVLSTELFYSSSGELATGEMTGVPALLLVAIALAMAALKDSLVTRTGGAITRVVVESGGRCELPKTLRAVSGALLVLTVLLLLTVYALIAVGAFSEGGAATGAWTLDNFSRGFGVAWGAGGLSLDGSGWESLIASLCCAFLVAPVGSAIGMMMVWIMRHVGHAAALTVEGVSAYLLSVPSVVIGAGFMLAFGGLGLSDAGAWVMILLAMLIRNLAVCLRFGIVALRRLDAAQLEMSGLSGASTGATFLHVVAPVLRPVFVLCVAYGFVRSMTMLGSVLLLSSAENQVATTYMIDRIGIGDFGVGMAYGVVLAACIVVVLVAGWRLVERQQRVPGWGGVLSDLKSAVVLVQKDGLRG